MYELYLLTEQQVTLSLQFDYFHELVLTQELIRAGARGYADGLLGGMVIGLPPVLNFGSEKLKQEIVPQVFAGKKVHRKRTPIIDIKLTLTSPVHIISHLRSLCRK